MLARKPELAYNFIGFGRLRKDSASRDFVSLLLALFY